MSLTKEYKNIYFSWYTNTGKTLVYNCHTKDSKHLLGQVKWYAQWRCYAFYPSDNCVFEKVCLKDIVDFIERLTTERLIQLQNKKQSSL